MNYVKDRQNQKTTHVNRGTKREQNRKCLPGPKLTVNTVHKNRTGQLYTIKDVDTFGFSLYTSLYGP